MPDDPIESVHPSAGDDPTRRSPTPEEDAILDTGATAFLAKKRAVVIGRYKLLKELGKGGFGIVWQAEQTEPIRREVALKIIKPGMDSREIIARFEAERQALALMDHPNIAAVLDAGTTDGGRPYFVMELVKGAPITEYCDAHKLGIRERLELFIPVCQAVQHAHQKAILHRDLKPSNILVTEVDGKPAPKVIDFGIAKALGTTREEMLQASLALTREGMVVGTPQYMSPEQAGSVPDVDTRSDVYTLGVILHELLTGQTPLSREELRQAAFDEMLRLIREGEIKRPSSRLAPITEAVNLLAQERNTEPKKLGHALRGDLDWILLKTLEKDRTRRYETANAFAQDLRSHLQNEPVSAGPPSAGYRLGKLVRRNRSAFAAAAAILLLLAAGITISTWEAVRATHAESLANTRLQEVAAQKKRADAKRQEAEDQRSRAELSAKAEAIQRHVAEDETRKAEAAAAQARENLSQSDFLQALRSIDEDRDDDALAQLARSLSLNPSNDAALCRLTTLLIYDGFALPISSMNHDGSVLSAEFSPDGKRIVTASEGGEARVWDAQTGQSLTKPLQHPGAVYSARFSPDGKRIVTVSGDEPPYVGSGFIDTTVRVWDAQTGKPLTKPLKADGSVLSAQFSPDGKRIVTGSRGGEARVWDAQSGKPLTKPLKQDGLSAEQEGKLSIEFSSAQFSPDGKRIVTAADNEEAGVWDAQTGKPLTKPLKDEDKVTSAQVSPDGKRIVTASENGEARVWDAQTGQPLTKPLKDEDKVTSAQFSPDGKRIVTASENGEARVWDAQTGQPLTDPMQHDDAVVSAQFSPDGNRIVTVSGSEIDHDKKARVWDAQSGQPLTQDLMYNGEVWEAEFSPDGKRIVTGSEEGEARVWDVQSGQPLAEPLKHDDKVSSAQFSPDGNRIVTASDDKTARVWDAQSGKPLTKPMKHDEAVYSAQFGPAGKWIVTLSGQGEAWVWDAQTGQPLTKLLKDQDQVTSAEFSPDGKRIVTASGPMHVQGQEDYGEARVWDAQSGQPLTGPMRHDDAIGYAQFSPDGKRILTLSGNAAQVWDAQSGQPLTGPMKQDDKDSSAQFSPDGKSILTVSDNIARVWDAQSGKPLTEPMQHDEAVNSAQFSRDGNRIVTVSGDTARVWDAQTGKPLTEPLKHDDAVNSAQFSPMGKWIVTASDDKTTLWDISPGGSAPEWLPRLADAVAGQHLNDHGAFEPLNEDPIRALEEIRAQLNRASADDDWTVFGRWFLADRSMRTISPFSKITVPEYIENRIKENTPESLAEAERLAIGNAELLQQIEKARADLPKASKPAQGNARSGPE